MSTRLTYLIMAVIKDAAIVSIDGCVVVIIMVLVGALATRYNVLFPQILDKHSALMLSKLILNVLLPCLLFVDMITTFKVSQIEEFGMLFLLCTGKDHSVHIVIGYGVGWIFCLVTGTKGDTAKLVKAAIAFQDTTAIPLAFAGVLGHCSETQGDRHFKSRATDHVLTYTVFVTVYKWSVAYQ
jgi:predicted permease